MGQGLPRAMDRLIEDLSKMPGIGNRSARRITNYILTAPDDYVASLLKNIQRVKKKIRFCETCNNLSEDKYCSICSDQDRDGSVICVVEQPSGLIAMEKSHTYDGTYHVLLGQISPIDGIGPKQLKVEGLLDRVRAGGVKEVVIATDFNTEGETTSLYLKKLLEPFKVKVSRLARGVPAGASVEYADIATLQRAFEERR